jgi:SAM-dependent methyltransferase
MQQCLMSFPDHFSKVAANYAAFRPRYPDALFAYIASVAPGRSLVWDCAAGSGQASVPLAAHFDRVIATDASASQISAATPHPCVEYRVALAEASGVADASCDAVTVAQAIHWFDLPRFYAEVDRVLVPNGIFAAWAYNVLRVDGVGIDEVIRWYHDTVVGPYWPLGRRQVEIGYSEILFPFDELDPPKFHMGTRWSLDDLVGYVRTWSAGTRYAEAHGHDPSDMLVERIEPVWGNREHCRDVTWPLHIRVGRRRASSSQLHGG